MRSLLKRVLGPQGILRVMQTLDWFRGRWLRVAVRWPLLARVHYLFFSKAFDGEARAVIAGHVGFDENKDNVEPVNYFLRRCVHRLEKGLIMRPRRPVFATKYIEMTVDSYLAGRESLNVSEVEWAHDVLAEYFAVACSHPVVERSRKKFAVATRPAGKCKPYLRDLSVPPPVDFDALKKLSIRRRSVRWFMPESVPRHLVDDAIELAALAPSACNRQPFEYRIFDEPELVRRVADLPMGIRGYEHNIPALAVLIGRLRAYPHPRDRHVIYIDASLSAMSFMYAIETMGLSSCPINWPDIPDRELAMRELLGLSADERPIMLIAFGYPDPVGLVPKSSKIPVSELRSYNKTASSD